MRVGNSLGVVETDTTGIVLAANTVQAFSGLVTLNLAFGSEAYVGANNRCNTDPGASLANANGNTQLDSGWSLAVTRAGLAYSSGADAASSRFLLTGKATLEAAAFGGVNGGIAIDMSSPGIELVNGQVQNFSLAVSAGFSLDSLQFTPNGSLGLRYSSSRSEIDLFGSAGVTVSNQAFALALGTGWNNPGIRLQYGANHLRECRDLRRFCRGQPEICDERCWLHLRREPVGVGGVRLRLGEQCLRGVGVAGHTAGSGPVDPERRLAIERPDAASGGRRSRRRSGWTSSN